MKNLFLLLFLLMLSTEGVLSAPRFAGGGSYDLGSEYSDYSEEGNLRYDDDDDGGSTFSSESDGSVDSVTGEKRSIFAKAFRFMSKRKGASSEGDPAGMKLEAPPTEMKAKAPRKTAVVRWKEARNKVSAKMHARIDDREKKARDQLDERKEKRYQRVKERLREQILRRGRPIKLNSANQTMESREFRDLREADVKEFSLMCGGHYPQFRLRPDPMATDDELQKLTKEAEDGHESAFTKLQEFVGKGDKRCKAVLKRLAKAQKTAELAQAAAAEAQVDFNNPTHVVLMKRQDDYELDLDDDEDYLTESETSSSYYSDDGNNYGHNRHPYDGNDPSEAGSDESSIIDEGDDTDPDYERISNKKGIQWAGRSEMTRLIRLVKKANLKPAERKEIRKMEKSQTICPEQVELIEKTERRRRLQRKRFRVSHASSAAIGFVNSSGVVQKFFNARQKARGYSTQYVRLIPEKKEKLTAKEKAEKKRQQKEEDEEKARAKAEDEERAREEDEAGGAGSHGKDDPDTFGSDEEMGDPLDDPRKGGMGGEDEHDLAEEPPTKRRKVEVKALGFAGARGPIPAIKTSSFVGGDGKARRKSKFNPRTAGLRTREDFGGL